MQAQRQFQPSKLKGPGREVPPQGSVCTVTPTYPAQGPMLACELRIMPAGTDASL